MAWLPRIIVSPFLAIYFVTAFLAWLVPLIIMGAARGQVARQQEADGNGDNQENQQEYANKCSWWQWGCNRSYYGDADQNQDANQDNQETSTPWWWFFASEEDQRRREESQSNNPALVLVYFWMLLLLTALVWFGYRQLSRGSDLHRVSVALAVFANFSLMTVFLIGGLEGGVQTEGRELEEQGFYSQFGVMMILTNLLYFLFSTAYAVLFMLRAKRGEVTHIEVDESDYSIHEDKETV
jgi:hypothetical protein